MELVFLQYSYDNIKLAVEPQTFSKSSSKEVLQYAVGGLLYMPATQQNLVDKIISGKFSFVKSLVLDLEDALGDDMVGFGQRHICKVAQQLDEAVKEGKLAFEDVPLIFIRVRNHQHIRDTLDMLGENIKYITGFNIPKFDKHCCDRYINTFQEVASQARSLTGTTLYIMPIIENKTAMYRQLRMDNLLYCNNALRAIHDNVLNIRVGGADFNSIFGIRRGTNHTIYDTGVIRSVLSDIINVFGKSYVVSGPVWEYFGTKSGEDGLRRELDADAINGFIGKTAIHPSQLPIIQEFYIVDYMDYMDAVGILGMNMNTTGVQKSASNRMNEVKTHTKWAQRTINMANVYGVRSKED